MKTMSALSLGSPLFIRVTQSPVETVVVETEDVVVVVPDGVVVDVEDPEVVEVWPVVVVAPGGMQHWLTHFQSQP